PVDALDLERLGPVVLHVLHREVGGFEEVRALVEATTLLEALSEGHFVHAVDRLRRRQGLERSLELAAELHAVLRAERMRELRRGEGAALDEDLAEPPVRLRLREQRVGQLRLGDQAVLDQQPAERAPRRRHRGELRLRLRLLRWSDLDAVLRREDARER